MFEKFFEMSRDLMCVATIDGYFIKVNPAWSKALGYTEKELTEKPIMDFVHPEDKERTTKVVAELNKGNDALNFENRFLHKNGTYRIISWSSRIDLKEKLLYATARDVTEQRHLEEKLNNLNETLFKHSIYAKTDKRGVILDVNENFCKVSGYSRDELIGKTHKIVNSGVHSKEFWKEMWNTILTGKTWSGVIENKKKSGESYHVFSIFTPQLDSQGNIEAFLAIRFEVTKEKLLQKDLNHTLQILNETNSIAKVGGWELIVETGELNWTDETFRILEVEKKEGQKPLLDEGLELFIPEHRSIIERAIERAIKYGEGYSLELKALTAKGHRFWVFTNGHAHWEDGKVVRLSGTIQDIHSQKMARLELDEERKRAAHNAKLATLGELAAGIAHEINNPLAVLIGTISSIQGKMDDPERLQKGFDAMERSCHRISAITNNLVKHARRNSDEELKAVKLGLIVEEAVSLATLKAKKFDTAIDYEINSNAKILCNEIEIEQVLINLINNAVDAINELKDKWVKIVVQDHGEWVVCRVMDSGTGMTKEKAKDIFEPFFTTKGVGEGTGLGLSISKGILEAHNSTISIDHNAKHTCFILTFPKHSGD